MSLALAKTRPRPPRYNRRTAVQLAGELPGLALDLLARTPREPPGLYLPARALAALAVTSPRANGYLSMEPGLRAFQTADGALTWVGHRHTAFAVGGLHVAPGGGDAARLAQAFRDALRAAGYRRALVFPAAEDERPPLAAAGVQTLSVGAEAFLDADDWTLRGKRRADLRQMVNRGTKRYGIRVREVKSFEAAGRGGPLYERWLSNRPAGHRMRLLIGTPCFDRPAARRYFIADQGAGEPAQALATLTPGWGGRGWGVDVMARDPSAPAGTMEVLLSDLIQRTFDEGGRVFSLGASPMLERTPLPPPDSGLLRPVFRWLLASRLGNRLFRFRSLGHFKDKFSPRWEPVYMGAWPRMSPLALYAGCRMWGLFGPPRYDTVDPEAAARAEAEGLANARALHGADPDALPAPSPAD